MISLDKAILELNDLLQKRAINKEPKKSDFDDLGDYIWARTLYRRFPKRLNGPLVGKVSSSDELNILWSWADGEEGVGIIAEGFKYLSFEESKAINEKDMKSSPSLWYRSKYPLFSLSQEGDIYYCEDDKRIYFIDFKDDWVYLISDSLAKFIQYLHELVLSDKQSDSSSEYSVHSPPKTFFDIAKKVGISEFYPFLIDETTRFHVD